MDKTRVLLQFGLVLGFGRSPHIPAWATKCWWGYHHKSQFPCENSPLMVGGADARHSLIVRDSGFTNTSLQIFSNKKELPIDEL